eukprot:TRINITY_DN26064_c0_g4_i1.p1 TRINITY_DN26064_c0_g4~~TRINITY_DN26064_c0_g4_i1.p1  ORF type:complete len:378 (-),score=36.97 TRINITY_DN26064_c0_g4_i1:76-1209(-)
MVMPPAPAGTGATDAKAGQAAAGRQLLHAAFALHAAIAAVKETSPLSKNSVASTKRRLASKDVEVGDDTAEEDEEGAKRTAGWQLLRAAFGMGGRSDPRGTSQGNIAQNEDPWNRERAFDIADSLEGGLARETSTDFTTPLRRSSKLWRFRIIRSQDRMQSRLVTDNGDFLIHAQMALESRTIEFFLYDPVESGRSLYSSSTPAFSMVFNESGDEWTLYKERCENCEFLPAHLSCAQFGKQQLAFIRHFREAVGDGVSNVMEVRIPGIYSDGTSVVWCCMTGKADLSTMHDDSTSEALHLTSMKPVWNAEVESLVLDFKGRHVVSSAKNFKLALSRKPKHVLCQFGKLDDTTFGLDFKYPLNVIQAFAVAMTTAFWK